jgi:hypothetical protein
VPRKQAGHTIAFAPDQISFPNPITPEGPSTHATSRWQRTAAMRFFPGIHLVSAVRRKQTLNILGETLSEKISVCDLIKRCAAPTHLKPSQVPYALGGITDFPLGRIRNELSAKRAL